MLINVQNIIYPYKKKVLNKTKGISLIALLTKPSIKYFNSIKIM